MGFFGKKNKPIRLSKWVVSYKWDSGEFELSVCRLGSKGQYSWGPDEDRKVILLEGHTKSHSKATRQRFREYASVFSDALNAQDT